MLVNGAAAKSSLLLRGGEAIEVSPAGLPPLKAAPEDLPLEVLYEDAAVIAINKPAGLVVHAGAGARSGTLVNRLVHHFAALSQVGGELRPGIVHRLDKDTSGVLLVARNDAAHRALAAQFAGRTVEKTYLALVHGKVRAEQGRITTPIARDPVRRTRMTARLATGRAALTEYRVLRAFREVHVSRSAHRHRPDAPDPRASGEHRASGRGRPSSMARRRPKDCSCMRGGSGSPARQRASGLQWRRRCPRNSTDWLARL